MSRRPGPALRRVHGGRAGGERLCGFSWPGGNGIVAASFLPDPLPDVPS